MNKLRKIIQKNKFFILNKLPDYYYFNSNFLSFSNYIYIISIKSFCNQEVSTQFDSECKQIISPYIKSVLESVAILNVGFVLHQTFFFVI